MWSEFLELKHSPLLSSGRNFSRILKNFCMFTCVSFLLEIDYLASVDYFIQNQKIKCYLWYRRKRLSNFDTDTQLRGQCQETAHSNAIRHLEDVWEIENLQGVWKSQDTTRWNYFRRSILILSHLKVRWEMGVK